MKVKVESEKVGLKLNSNIMASGPITSWQIDGETLKTEIDFTFSGSKITADYDCSHEIKRRLLLEIKAMTNLDSIFKSRDITLPTKVCLVKLWNIFSSYFPIMWYWSDQIKFEKKSTKVCLLFVCDHGCMDELWARI